MNLYIGADLGTSALKLLLIDSEGKILNSVFEIYDVYYPKAGWSEQNPSDWWDAFRSGVKKLISGIEKDKIKAIGVCGQMHGLVALDKEDNVIRPAILWNDGRCDKETDYLNTVIGKEKLSSLTANIAFAGFTAPKILWMQNNEKDNFDKISKIMLPKDYINYLLTGVHSTDYSDASGMLLLDVKNKKWSEGMMKICGISEQMLPKLFESYEKIGNIKKEIAEELDLCEDVIVCAGAGDNAGAAIGTATTGEGKCNISLGTSGTIFISSKNFGVDKNNALHSFCHSDGGFHLMGCMLSAASCNKWFCDEILKTKDYGAEQKSINEEMLGNNHIYFLPYLMGERSPINDTDARGVFFGLRADTKREDIVLSVLEGVCFAVRDSFEVAKSLGIKIERSTVCGGGAKSHLWRKILSNILGIELEIPAYEEGPGYGAALLSMVALGEYSSVKECTDKLIRKTQTVKPDESLIEKYNEKYNNYKKIYPALKDVYKEIKGE